MGVETQPFGNALDREPLGRLSSGFVFPSLRGPGVSGHFHRGVDIACPVGTPIRLVLSGVVTVLPFDASGFGNGVQCEGARYRMTYGHLSVVKAMSGMSAVHGDLVGLSGSSGNSTGPHIHFELFDKAAGAWVDPWTAV